MLMIHQNALYSQLGAVLSALIVVFCFVGLTLHRNVFAGIPRKDFFWYYTNLSNLLVLFYFSFAAPYLYAVSALHTWIPIAEFSVTAAIMLTHAVFHFIIFPGVLPQIRRVQFCGDAAMLTCENLLVHYAVPWLVFAYYLLCSPGKNQLPIAAAPLWLTFPLSYILAIFTHAKTIGNIPGTERRYPYPFLDADLFGRNRVALTCLFLFTACVLSSVAFVCIIHSLYALAGTKALFLV